VTRAALALALAVACGPPARKPTQPTRATRDAGADAARDAAPEAGPSALETLAARRDELAPGAREAARAEIDLARQHALPLPVFDADTCVRVAFVASAETDVALVDAKGMKLASADGTEGALGASGPVCLRKGDAATLRLALARADGGAVSGSSRLHVVVWATP
jgi:hypothetical protein